MIVFKSKGQKTKKMDIKNIYKLFGYVFFSNLFFERAIFVLYLLYKGLSISQIAVFQGIINISMMVGEIPTGIIADNIGKKRGLMLGNIMMVFYYCCLLFSNEYFSFIVGAIMFGVGSTFISGTDEAYLYDLIPNPKRSIKFLGQLSALITISTGIAMLFGGYIQKVQWELVMILGIISQIMGIAILFTLPNIVHKKNKEIRSAFSIIKEFLIFLKKDSFSRYVIIFLGFNVGVVSAIYIWSQELLSAYGMKTEYISIAFVIDTIVSVIVFSQIEKVILKLGKKRTLILSLVLSIFAFLLFAVSEIYLVVLAVVLISVLNNYFSTIFMDLFNNNMDASIRATSVSCFNMVSALLMAIIFFVISRFSQNYVWLLSFMGVASSVLIIWIALKFKRLFY